MIKSYIAKYRAATPDIWLIGAVKESQSHRWHQRAEAASYLAGVIDINGGTERCVGAIIPSILAPEDLKHCPGFPAQVLNGICFGCGKKITREDIKAWKGYSVYQAMRDAGVEIDSHESDLYVPITAESTQILKMYPLNYKNATIFNSNIDGRPHYDIPFSYDPFHEAKVQS